MSAVNATSGLRARDYLLVTVVATVGVVLLMLRKGAPVPPHDDALIYVQLAGGLLEYRVFGRLLDPAVAPSPEFLVAPLYPAFLTVLAEIDPALRAALVCQAEKLSSGLCPQSYMTLAYAQGALVVVLGLCVWLTAWHLFHKRSVAWAAMLAMFPSGATVFYARQFLTEGLALPLFGLFTVFLLLSVRNPDRLVWPALTGLSVALLALTRPVFAYVFWPLLLLGVAVFLWRRGRPVIRNALLVFALTYAVALTPWMLRNKIVFDQATIADSGYGGETLSHRVGYNRMSLSEWAVAFVYWFPDFGDSLAKALFPPHTYEKLGWDSRGYYRIGVEQIKRRTLEEAGSREAHLRHVLQTEVLNQPFKHLAVSLPLAWRSMFVNGYWGVFGWICCVWLLWHTTRLCRWEYLIICLPPFLLVALNAMVSASVARYSVPLVPVLSVAMGAALVALVSRFVALRRERDTAT